MDSIKRSSISWGHDSDQATISVVCPYVNKEGLTDGYGWLRGKVVIAENNKG